MEQSFYVHSLLQVLSKATILMHVNLLNFTMQMVVLIFNVLVLIIPTVLWHIMTPSKSTLLANMSVLP